MHSGLHVHTYLTEIILTVPHSSDSTPKYVVVYSQDDYFRGLSLVLALSQSQHSLLLLSPKKRYRYKASQCNKIPFLSGEENSGGHPHSQMTRACEMMALLKRAELPETTEDDATKVAETIIYTANEGQCPLSRHLLILSLRVSLNTARMHRYSSLMKGTLAVLGLNVLLIDFVDFGCARTHVDMLDELIESAGGTLCFSNDLDRDCLSITFCALARTATHTVPSDAFST